MENLMVFIDEETLSEEELLLEDDEDVNIKK